MSAAAFMLSNQTASVEALLMQSKWHGEQWSQKCPIMLELHHLNSRSVFVNPH